MKLVEPDASAIAGRAVIVTGAASGIGRALAVGFLRDGASVVAIDRDAEGLRSLGGAENGAEKLSPLVADVTSPETLEEAVRLCLDRSGRVDVLFNNAGFGLRKEIAGLTAGEFESVYAVHVLASLYGIRAVSGPMRAQGYGRIISVVSRAAEACQPSNSAYSSAKAALWAVSRTAASELAGDGILVNCLIPGMTNTGIWGRPRPELQEPEAVYPTALALATLPPGGPNGRVFWDLAEYRLFENAIGRDARPAGIQAT